MRSHFRVGAGLLGVALIAALAGPSYSLPPDESKEWDIKGHHSKLGDYTGTLKTKKSTGGTYTFDAQCKLTSDGKKFSWSGKGKKSWGWVRLDVKVGGVGLAGAVGGTAGATETGSGTYRFSSDGKSVEGSWKTKGGKSKETGKISTDDDLPANGALSLSAVGKDLKEEVVPVWGIEGTDSVIDLKVKKVPGAASLELVADSKFVELYKDEACKTAVEKTLSNADATFKVKGVIPTAPATPSEVKLVAKDSAGKTLSQETVKVHVARSAFKLSGHGDFERGSHIKDWLNDGRTRDSRKNPFITLGKDQKTQKPVYYALFLVENEKGASVALSTPDSVVCYHGHSNFGLGYAFETGFKKISEFYNIAEPQLPVNWQYLREHQEHPDLMIDDKEYGDDSATPEFSDPGQQSMVVRGVDHDEDTVRYPLSGGSPHHHLKRGTGGKKYLDHHYGSDDNWRIIVKAGSADMPAKRWSKLLLLSCYSGPYYFNSFGGRGTLFYTHDEALCASEAGSVWLEGQISGKSDAEILKEINKIENIHDYWDFGGN